MMERGNLQFTVYKFLGLYYFPQQRLYFLPDPHGHEALRLILDALK